MMQRLEANPLVQAMLVYEDAQSGILEPQSFLVVCRDKSCRQRWYAESDVVEYELERRTTNKHLLRYYDGSTQRSYHNPPKAWETLYCRREPTPFECAHRGLDPTRQVFESSSFFRIEEEQGGVFAAVDMPKGSYILPSHLAASWVVQSESVAQLKKLEGASATISSLLEYINKNGHTSVDDRGHHYVEVGLTQYMRSVPTELANVGSWIRPQRRQPVYSPVYERYQHSFSVFLVATRDIEKGDELLKESLGSG